MNDSSAKPDERLEALKGDLANLRAAIEPLSKQTQDVFDRRNRLEREVLQAQLDLLRSDAAAAGRHAARIQQLEQDIAKITAAIPSDPARNDKELKKLDAEIASINVATAKTISETKGKAGRAWAGFIEFLQVAATAIPLAAVAVALLTLWATQETQRTLNEREQQKQLSLLAEGLGQQSPTIRAARASALAPYLKDQQTLETVTTILISAILQEEDDLVRGALRGALEGAGPLASVQAAKALPTIRAALEKVRLDYGQTQNDLRGLGAAADRDRQKDLTRKQDELAARRRARQHAAVTLALIARDQAPAGCPKKPCGKCDTNLTSFYLDDFDFADVQADLCAADFTGSSLVNANFTSVKLSHARFERADLRQATFRRSTLQDADFSNSKMGWQSAGEGKAHPFADFRDADLRSAKFTRACLSWVDLTNTAYPLQVDQLRDAYALGARLPSQLEAQLKAAQALKGGPGCTIQP